MNKTKRLSAVLISLILILSIIFITSFKHISSKRYEITAPMSDLEYKTQIIKESKNLTYKLEALRPLAGLDEVSKLIKENDNNAQIYVSNFDNKLNGIFRANLHMHTTNSDGTLSVEDLLNKAQKYGETLPDGEFMYVAITDHNTVNGAKNVIKILEKNQGKYDRIKVIAGLEINTEYHNSKITNAPVQIHVLAWCINPYDKYLNKIFIKKNLKDKWNNIDPHRDFDWTIKTMQNYGLVGVAHPARYSEFLNEKKYAYITEMLNRYKTLITNGNLAFTEGYYQSYKTYTYDKELNKELINYIDYIEKEALKIGLIRTGSQDTHGLSIFSN